MTASIWSGTTAIASTANANTTNNTTKTTTTTTTTYDTTAVVDGTADEVVAMITARGDEDGDARMSGCKCDSPRTSVIHFGSCKPFASSACAHR